MAKRKTKNTNNFHLNALKALGNIKQIAWYEVEFDPEIGDTTDLNQKLSQLKEYKFKDFHLEAEETKRILEYGLSKIINPHYEYFTGRPNTRRTDYILAIQQFIDKILKGKSLVIIDPYIFPKKCDDDYVSFLITVLSAYLKKLSSITFVTSPKFNITVQEKIFNELRAQNSDLTVTLKTTDEFHDRFWISPRNRKGIFMGTSLNGLGKKYTLIDYVNDEDIRIILSELKKILK